jgi:D-tyrosyl-tRNA(Tyr) deacylase
VFGQRVRYLWAAVEAPMRAVVQRVAEARVTVDSSVIAEIGQGLCVLLGVGTGDTEADANHLCDKVIDLRLFDDAAGRLNCSLRDVGGSLLVVSQFTLYGDCRKGRRPSFTGAAAPARAEVLYDHFVARARAAVPVATGQFQARMRVGLVNDGPVTVLLDSTERGR